MTKRTGKTGGTQGAGSESTALTKLLAPLVDGMTATRQQLLAWVQSAGLVALDAVFRAEATALAGVKGRHDRSRTHHHWGATARRLTFGGRQVSLACPRVRSRDGHEAALPSVVAFRELDPLTSRVMEQLLLGVSTRGYAASLEAGSASTRNSTTNVLSVARAAATAAGISSRFVTRMPGRPCASASFTKSGLTIGVAT